MTTALGSAAPAEVPHAGRTELGTVRIDDRVVAKLAAHAAAEVPDAGAAAPRLLGRPFGPAVPGVSPSRLGGLPKVTVDVDLSVVTIALTISVRWPAAVPDVVAAVRERVSARIAELTGLTVTEVDIEVTDLVTHLDPPPRVR